ncbi:unnamed protein product [Tuber melanosporum]|uniref:(Perigord truffle) hypothetical protein n=1 Tax=Tuber melanosporum (strain Mel28) TaxID=656061 RepID=D5G899_TUBMM|nr:uncharacterized protein GSTUM_00002942001 [Tuber melanosporum]CAZ80742.1 unnamed protein product [Tuber melanosporum]
MTNDPVPPLFFIPLVQLWDEMLRSYFLRKPLIYYYHIINHRVIAKLQLSPLKIKKILSYIGYRYYCTVQVQAFLAVKAIMIPTVQYRHTGWPGPEAVLVI